MVDRVGDMRIAPRSDYEDGAEGYVIEMFDYWNQDRPSWAVPAWEERGLAYLAGVFATVREAAVALGKHFAD